MIRISLFISLVFNVILLFGQQVRLNCERYIEDDLYQKSQAILPVYKYTGLEIEEYAGFGADTSDLKTYAIEKLPQMEGCRDTGYTYIYFAGANSDKQQSYILALVGNYVWSKRPTVFWVDRNNDLDFTNDGPPDTLIYGDSTMVIELVNLQDTSAKYALRLTRFKRGVNWSYKILIQKHYERNSGNKIFTTVNYSFREQRYNTVLATYRTETDSFVIGLKDVDVNGYYNDQDIDKYYVGAIGSTVSSVESEVLGQPKNRGFEWNGKYYRIRYIDPSGRFIDIEYDAGEKLENVLKIGRSTPNFEYTDIKQETHKLSENKKKEVYLFFWDIESLTTEDRVYLTKIHQEFSDRITVICLNHGDPPKNVRITVYYDKLNFPLGYSTQEIADLYFMEEAPRGYYLGKRCKLKNDNISPKEMYDLLSQSSR